MNHWYFVALAYVSFSVLLLWDLIAPQLSFKLIKRKITLRELRKKTL